MSETKFPAGWKWLAPVAVGAAIGVTLALHRRRARPAAPIFAKEGDTPLWCDTYATEPPQVLVISAESNQTAGFVAFQRQWRTLDRSAAAEIHMVVHSEGGSFYMEAIRQVLSEHCTRPRTERATLVVWVPYMALSYGISLAVLGDVIIFAEAAIISPGDTQVQLRPTHAPAYLAGTDTPAPKPPLSKMAQIVFEWRTAEFRKMCALKHIVETDACYPAWRKLLLMPDCAHSTPLSPEVLANIFCASKTTTVATKQRMPAWVDARVQKVTP